MSNTLKNLEKEYKPFKNNDCFPSYPFGSDFTETELTIIKALTYLKGNTKTTLAKLKLVAKAYYTKTEDGALKPYLERMELLSPQTKEEKLNKRLLVLGLSQIK